MIQCANQNWNSFANKASRPALPMTGWYSALMLQPRIVGGAVALGIVLQSPQLFLALSAMLWWSTLVPTAQHLRCDL